MNKFSIREATWQDSTAIWQLFNITYHGVHTLCKLENIAQLIGTQNSAGSSPASYVACDGTRIVGFIALMPDLTHKVIELSGLIVHPDYRRLGIAEELTDVELESRDKYPEYTFTVVETRTSHLYSSQMAVKRGFAFCGLQFLFGHDPTGVGQRESLASMVLDSHEAIKNSTGTIFIPHNQPLENFVNAIYRNFGVCRNIRYEQEELPSLDASITTKPVGPPGGVVVTYVNEYGKNLIDLINQAKQEYSTNSCHQVQLNISKPYAPVVIRELINMGYFPSGLYPLFGLNESGERHDILVMSYLNPSEPFDPMVVKLPDITLTEGQLPPLQIYRDYIVPMYHSRKIRPSN